MAVQKLIAISALCLSLYGCTIVHNKTSDPYLVILNGSGESLSVMEHYDDNIRYNVAFTGQSPNQILQYSNDIYIVNSLSNSITVYDKSDLSLKAEYSTGDSTNPYKMLIFNERIYITAYCTHEVIIMSMSGSIEKHIPLDKSGQYFAYPEGIARYKDTIFVACKDSMSAGADSCNPNGGRVAVIRDLQVVDYIPTNAADTSNVTVIQDMLLVISSGTYNGGFDENGLIEYCDLSQGLTNIRLTTAASGRSFGVCTIVKNKAYCGCLGSGKLICYDTTSTVWNVVAEKQFDGSGSLSFVSDIVYDQTHGCLYATEFNGNQLYKLMPDTLEILWHKTCSTGNRGDAQGILLTN